ncbi:MAG: response regulator [Rhodospirillales bacterium]|nr:response regulator [Rhodospirillales bacterium]
MLADPAARSSSSRTTPLPLDRRALFDDAPVAMAILDLSGTVLAFNAALQVMVGAQPCAAAGRAFIELLCREDRDEVSGQLSKLAMGTTRGGRLGSVRIQGEAARPVAIEARRLAGSDRAIVYLIEESEAGYADVRHVQAQKMQALGQLAGGIAHDFNNLLTAMLGHCDLLLERHAAPDPSHDDVVQVRAAAARASELVRQLLAFSRKQSLKPVALDINRALRALSTLLARLLGETVALDLELSAADGVVRVDPGQLDQVVINLAVNARDAMPGGGRLSIRTQDRVLTAPLDGQPDSVPPGRYVTLAVGDTGVGIPKEIIASIFEPFFTTKEVGGGTGLGLATVYGIVRQTGGFVTVDSAPGAGTTFCLYLPAAELGFQPAEDAVPAPDQSGSLPRATGATVLLVEDETAVRRIAAKALTVRGYRVIEAGDGEDALQLLGERPEGVDLILTDLVMPGMDGGTFARLVRQEWPSVPVILMSGYADEGQTPVLADVPSSQFLAKPFSLAELVAKVGSALETRIKPGKRNF